MKKRLIILGIILFIFFLIFYQFLIKGRWDGKRRINIAINFHSPIIFSVEPRNRKAAVFTLPSNTILQAPFGYGEYPASSIYRLGELENEGFGGFLLKKSLEKSLSISIEGYISPKKEIKNFSLNNYSDITEMKTKIFSLVKFPNILLQILGLQRQFLSDLSDLDLLRLWNAARNVKVNRITFVDLAKSNVLHPDKLADGTPVFLIDKEMLDSQIGDSFQDSQVRNENVSIEIINASPEDGLAGWFGKILTHMGANVIIKNTAKSEEKFSCKIVLKDKTFGKNIIVSRLLQIYNCSRVVYGKDVTFSQAEISIILGGGFLK